MSTVSNCNRKQVLMQITHPFAHFPSNANILTFLPLFEFFRFILYYFWASCILSGEFTLSKGKKLRGNVVFTTTAIRICFALLAVIFKLPFIWRISLKTKMSPFFSQMLAFSGHPFYFDYQDFISLASDFISTF